MFGKPQWFRPKRWGWGLTPVSYQGWLYTLAWILVIVVPFQFLLWYRGTPEAIVWMATAIGVLCWDVHTILQAINQGKPPTS